MYLNKEIFILIYRKYTKTILLITTTLLLTTQALLLSNYFSHHPARHSSSVAMSISLLFELSKLIISSSMQIFVKNPSSISSFFFSIFTIFHGIPWQESRLYSVPALIYLINDNLQFSAFSLIDGPTTFEMLGNMRILTTALLFKLVLKKQLHKYQWCALLLLGAGTATSQLVTCGSKVISNLSFAAFLLTLAYCILSSFAGVYTEYLLKKKSSISLHLQNVHLYSYSVFFNTVVLLLYYSNDVKNNGIVGLAISDWSTALLILNHSLSGLAISALVKYADNISRIYAHSLSMLITMVISAMIQQEMPSVQMFFGMMVVIISVYVYFDIESTFKNSKNQYLT